MTKVLHHPILLCLKIQLSRPESLHLNNYYPSELPNSKFIVCAICYVDCRQTDGHQLQNFSTTNKILETRELTLILNIEAVNASIETYASIHVETQENKGFLINSRIQNYTTNHCSLFITIPVLYKHYLQSYIISVPIYDVSSIGKIMKSSYRPRLHKFKRKVQQKCLKIDNFRDDLVPNLRAPISNPS